MYEQELDSRFRQNREAVLPQTIKLQVRPTPDEAPVPMTVGFGDDMGLWSFRGSSAGDESARGRSP